MDKKLFIGATIITATVIGGLVYYRHQVRQAMEDLTMDDDHEEDNVPVRIIKETDAERLGITDLLDEIEKGYRTEDRSGWRRGRPRYPNRPVKDESDAGAISEAGAEYLENS